MHRKCELSATSLLLGFILTALPAGKHFGVMGAKADLHPFQEATNVSTTLGASRSNIPLPHIIQLSGDTGRSDSPYLSGLSPGSRYPTKVILSAQGLGRLHIEASAESCAQEKIVNRSGEVGGLFFLRHSDLINIGSWRFEHGFGDQTAGLDDLVLASNRFSFSSTEMRGVSGIADNGLTRFNWTIGNVGQLSKTSTKPFEITGDGISGVGVNHRLNRHWQVGAQTLSLTRSDSAEHQSLATVVQYTDTEKRDRYAFHMIKDSEQRSGYWFDMTFRRDKWRHYYSFYRFEPNLNWSTVWLPDDRQGIYWKAESSGSDLDFSAGLEFEQRNLNHDRTRKGHIRTRGFGSFTHTWSKSLTVEGRLRTENQRRFAGLSGLDRQRVSLGLSLDKQSGFGHGQLDFYWSSTHSEAELRDTIHVCLDHEWQLTNTNKITTRLAVDRNTQDHDELIHPAAGLIFSRAMSQQIAFVGSLYYVVDEDSEPIDMSSADWCEGQIGCLHGTGGSVWVAMKASLQ